MQDLQKLLALAFGLHKHMGPQLGRHFLQSKELIRIKQSWLQAFRERQPKGNPFSTGE